MIDMHKLKLKYRQLSTNYADALKQPVFQQSKRSYTYLPATSQLEVKQVDEQAAESIMNSPNYSTNHQVTPHNELMGETAARLKTDMSDPEHQAPEDHPRKSTLTAKNSSF
jgi:hypothetical protein